MAKDASKVRVALTGDIIVAEVGTPDPIDLNQATIDALGVNLGYTTPDGVTFNFSKEVEEIMGWQSMEALRKLITASPKSASFVLRQLERSTWLTTMGGNVSETTTGSGLYKWEPDDAFMATKKLYIHFQDGDIHYLFGFRRAQQSAEVEMNLVRNDAVNLPNEWSALASDVAGQKSWFVLTNDPAFAPAAA